MMGHTHGLIGAAIGLGLATAFHLDAQHTLGLIALGGAMALAPDIDHPRAPLRRKMGVAGHLVLGRLKHRGITHTLIALVAVATAAFCLLPLPYALGAASGYLSHLLADMLTVSGLPVFWPYNRNSVHIIPNRFCITTNTLPEHVLGLFLLLLIAGQSPHFGG